MINEQTEALIYQDHLSQKDQIEPLLQQQIKGPRRNSILLVVLFIAGWALLAFIPNKDQVEMIFMIVWLVLTLWAVVSLTIVGKRLRLRTGDRMYHYLAQTLTDSIKVQEDQYLVDDSDYKVTAHENNSYQLGLSTQPKSVWIKPAEMHFVPSKMAGLTLVWMPAYTKRADLPADSLLSLYVEDQKLATFRAQFQLTKTEA